MFLVIPTCTDALLNASKQGHAGKPWYLQIRLKACTNGNLCFQQVIKNGHTQNYDIQVTPG